LTLGAACGAQAALQHGSPGAQVPAPQAGFTLIELMVICVLAAILAAISLPGFSQWLPNYRLKSATRDAFSNFQLAKLTAIRAGANCTVTFNQVVGGRMYDYVIYVDSDNDLEYDAGERVVTRVVLGERYKGVDFDTSQGGGDGITFTDNDDVPGRPSVAFLPNGFTTNNAGATGAGSVFFVNSKNRTANVAVSALGNIRVN
jgi:Tfp pilus assembly protein FimT